jgi:hypothetical protein
MSRRHHGRPRHHAQGGSDRPRRVTGVSPGLNQGPDSVNGAGRPPAQRPPGPLPAQGSGPVTPPRPIQPATTPTDPAPASPTPPTNGGSPVFVPHVDARTAPPVTAPAPGGPPVAAEPPGAAAPGAAARPSVVAAPAAPAGGPGPTVLGPDRNGQCTAPQLRRFIKSRPYVPMHELRRRFGIDGGDDDVTPVRLEPGWVYVGLPSREGMLLGELLRAGEIGYELSLDPRSPIVIGVYPMRPIPRG